MRMEKGDIYGLVGMCLGIGAITDVVLYLVYAGIPIFDFIMPVIRIICYVVIFGGGTVGVILSIIGISKNRSKFGSIGLITSLLGIAIFILMIFFLPTL